MINVKNEIQCILVIRLLTDMTEAGFMTAAELKAAKRLAVEKYRPFTVWE